MLSPVYNFIFKTISCSSQCSTTGITKAMVCAILCGMVHIKEPLLLIGKNSHVAAAGFLSRYLNGPLPYVRRHITVTKCVECIVK